VPVSLEEDAYQTSLRGGLQIHEEIDVPGGDIYLLMGIYDFNTESAAILGVSLQTVQQARKRNRLHPEGQKERSDDAEALSIVRSS